MKNYLNNQLGIVFPVSYKVLLPNVVTSIHMELLDDGLAEYLENEEAVKIALPLKQNFGKTKKVEEDFYRTGVTFEVISLERSEKGVRLSVKLLDRVEIKELHEEDDIMLASYEISPDHKDLDEKNKKEMVGYIKKVSGEISSRFTGGEQYQKIVEGFDDLNSLIVYLSQFLQIPAIERYELLEMQSEKERGLRFLYHLLKTKEMIQFQMEI